MRADPDRVRLAERDAAELERRRWTRTAGQLRDAADTAARACGALAVTWPGVADDGTADRLRYLAGLADMRADAARTRE